MSVKKLSIPILPHLIKFLDREYEKKGDSFLIRHKIIPPRYLNPKKYREYFKNPSARYTYIYVTTNDSRLYKLYSWIQHVDNHFSQRLIDYVAIRYDLQHVSVSIRDFLSSYNITESEYAFDTAYKKWQRSKTYEKLKEDKEYLKCQA